MSALTPNDTYANAGPLTGVSGGIGGNAADATVDANAAWFHFTPTITGVLDLTLSPANGGAATDILLRTGTTFAGSTEVPSGKGGSNAQRTLTAHVVAGTTYRIGVVMSHAGDTNYVLNWSNIQSVPDAPTNVVAVGGNAQASITWTAPTWTGTSAITRYLVTAVTTGVEQIVTGTSYTFTGLLNGAATSFDVRAVNSVGGSAPTRSNVVTPTAVTPPPPPPPPPDPLPPAPTPQPTAPTTPTRSPWVMPAASTNPVPAGAPYPAPYVLFLTDPNAIRCILVEVTVAIDDPDVVDPDVPLYLSNRGYTTQGSDTPANTAYLPIIQGGVQFKETLELDSASLSYGDIELNNVSGEFDLWLDYIWTNKEIKIYSGDVRWPRSQFEMVFNGVVDDLDSRDRTTLNIKLRDKLQRLNTPVTETKLGGTTQSKDMLIPVVIGEVHNMLPVLIDPALHTYQFHQRSANMLIEVRDNGAPVMAVGDIIEGKFTLTGSPAGRITCSAQGDNVGSWPITVAKCIERLVTAYGKEEERFTSADIDAVNFNAFDAAQPQPVGIAVTQKTNVFEVCQQLAKSVGANLMCNRLGLLQLVKLQFPGLGVPLEIGPDDMIHQTFEIIHRTEVQAAVKLAYCKNWTVQTALNTGILEEHKNRFATEWDTKTVRYSSIAAKHNAPLEVEQRETMLLRLSEAEPEAWRLLDMLCKQRHVYSFEGLPHLNALFLGQAVLLSHSRYGLEEGKPGVVVGISPNWLTGRPGVEIMV